MPLDFLERVNAPHWLKCLYVLAKYAFTACALWFLFSLVMERGQFGEVAEYVFVVLTVGFMCAAVAGAEKRERDLFVPPTIYVYISKKVTPIESARARSRESHQADDAPL